MYTIKFAESYRNDVKSAVNYIKNNLQNPIAAQRLKDVIKNKVKKIKENPLIFSRVPDKYLASKGYRFSIINNYLIFFMVNEKQIDIIRFLYGYRDWINILEK
ncbi:MAG: type II toxin-antitoxin system RelE/ParE family toxin [Treponema sp.]|jgi:addiction module RelE/StbE family toxin|nr:type II toxin-antitoxin system RelE/ParE family toxin [Treponema sp.]